MNNLFLPNKHSTLKDEPEVARLLGIYVSTFSLIEFQVFKLFRALVKSNDNAAHVIMNQIANFAGKLNLVEDLITSLPNHRRGQEIRQLVNKLRAENKERNILVHGIFALDSNGQISVVSNAAKVRAAPGVHPARQSTLEMRCRKAEELYSEILDLVPS